MEELVYLVKIVSEKVGLSINASKSKVMMVDWAKCLPVFTALSNYEKVNAFVYLGFINEKSMKQMEDRQLKYCVESL